MGRIFGFRLTSLHHLAFRFPDFCDVLDSENSKVTIGNARVNAALGKLTPKEQLQLC